MRRAGNLWGEIASFAALERAARRAARGKRATLAAARFLERLEPECLALERELGAGTWRPSPASRFRIRDPKPRLITAVPFRDRVVHHALMGALEPVFERRMVGASYACRRGKGLHRALGRVLRLTRRYDFCLRMDVASFFPSLDHDVVVESVERLVKDRRALALVATIVRDGGAGRGLPIGSLTSQWLANLVLDRLDHHVLEVLRVPGYVRYMDDLVFFAPEREELRDVRAAVTAFLGNPLLLEPKERATQLLPTSCGVPFLGFAVFRRTVRLRPANLRRTAWRLGYLRRSLERGTIGEERYRRAVGSVVAHVAWGDTRELRRRWFGGAGLEL